ncbi:MAG TPA: glycoside hydrolase domain-containing protein, partial [Gemmatimonadales bacterium]
NSVRPIWVSLDIPPGTPPGRYQGTIDVAAAQGRATLRTQITVQPQTLPAPHDWKFRLDLWQNPWVVAWYYHVEPWSGEHKALLQQHLALYANAGGTFITTYAVHSPWSDNSYMIEGSMIEWTKRTDGTWKFDYDIFDQYVQLAIAAGVDRAITVYTPLPWGNRFRYLDGKSGNYVYETWAPDSAQFASVWNAFLTDLKGHLEQRGWFDRTYLGINENEMQYTLAAIRVIRAHSPKWKITYAGNWHTELDSLLDDYSPIITGEPSQQELQNRTARGRTTTYYVCCTPQKPNTFVFSPPIEGRYIGWYAMAYGYNGFLRWAYDAWPADPVRDARHVAWPAGDEFLVYPGGGSSVRFEKLREGIVDYEKIRILRELAAQSTNRDIKRQMRAFDDHLRTFVGDRDYNKRNYDETRITDAVQKGLRMLETLSERLGQ